MLVTPALQTRPTASEYAPYFDRYVTQVPAGDLLDTFRHQLDDTLGYLRAIPEERGGHRYGEGKWSIREVVGHLADTERVMSYRALCIARGDVTPLPAFDENAYVSAANFDRRSLAGLASEFQQVRLATIALFASLDEDALLRRGVASQKEVTARALAYIIAGHERHHLTLLRERYG